MNTKLLGIPLCCCSFFACSHEQEDWATAELEHTIAAYEAFLEQHPEGAYADSANARLDESLWQRAVADSSADGYEAYLKRYANGRYADSASRIIAVLEDWAIAENENTVAAYEAFLEQHPQGSYAGRAEWFLAAESASRDIAPVKLYRSNVIPYGRSKLLTIFNPRILSGNRVELSYRLENAMEEEPVLTAAFNEANIAAQTSSFYYAGRGYEMSKGTIRFSPRPHGGWVHGRAKVRIYLIMADDNDGDELRAVSNVVTLYLEY
jgi:hypothetical protein